jgi:DNA-binding PadR family transcriptional regulator
MEKAGLVQGKWQKLPTGQERRYYTITSKGQEVLNQRLISWQDFSKAVALIVHSVTG